MNLKNIELRHCSITDIDDSFGKFDYIICHGVFSWVPSEVQQKILEIAKKNLVANGIAYISYNTLPGWNMVRTVRDMMLYHTQYVEPKEKVNQARSLLAFISENVAENNTPYSNMLANEAKFLAKQADSYIAHDHLESVNKQFYFSEFMSAAESHGLQYLADTSLASMYLGNMKPSVIKKLQTINDIVRTEQYLDFLNNRRFRKTLLCHNDIMLNRNVNVEHIKQFAMMLDIVPEKEYNQADVNDDSVVLKFFYQNNPESWCSATSTALKAILHVFARSKSSALKFDTIVERANELCIGDHKAQIAAELLNNAMNLVLKDHIEIWLTEKDKTKVDLEKPHLNDLALYQVKGEKNWLTNTLHKPVSINYLDKFALKMMDGTNNRSQIINSLRQEVEKKTIVVKVDGNEIEDTEELTKQLTQYLNQLIDNMSKQAVLI